MSALLCLRAGRTVVLYYTAIRHHNKHFSEFYLQDGGENHRTPSIDAVYATHCHRCRSGVIWQSMIQYSWHAVKDRELEVVGEPEALTDRCTHTRTNGRTTRKRNASSPSTGWARLSPAGDSVVSFIQHSSPVWDFNEMTRSSYTGIQGEAKKVFP